MPLALAPAACHRQSAPVTSPPDTVACAHCGALNGGDFGRCIRCNQPLQGATPAAKATRRIPVRRPRPVPLQESPDRLFGRFAATELPAAKLLVALNAVVFTAHLLTAWGRDPSIGVLLSGGDLLDAFRFGALPIGKLSGVAPLNEYVLRAEPWRLLSACFVHYGAIHFGMNMLGLVYLARLAEPAVGSIRFIILYVLTGLFGFASSVGWFVISPNAVWTAGASGAVFGIMGMVLGFLWRRRDPRWKAWLMQAVVYSLGFTLLLPSVNHSAHIGGLLSGVVIGALFARGAPQAARSWQRWLAWLCVLACVAALTLVHSSPYLPIFEAALQNAR